MMPFAHATALIISAAPRTITLPGGAALTSATILGLAAAALIGLGLYGAITARAYLRRIIACNILGGGIFLLMGVAARRGAAAGFESDPVPQALVITGIVVAFAATVLAVTLLMRFVAVSDHEDRAP